MSEYKFKQNGNRDDGWITSPDGRTITTLSKKDTSLVMVGLLNSELSQQQAEIEALRQRNAELEADLKQHKSVLKMTKDSHLKQHNRIQELATENEKAVKYSANLADAIRQHLIIWNHICDANRQDNAVILATDTNQAMLDTLDSVKGNFSMVWVSDAFTPLKDVLGGKDSYFIKLYKELIEEKYNT